MKFLHTADWQIGRIYAFEADGDGHDPAAALAKARYDVVAQIAALATTEQVDAVLVAGDVFDKQALSDSSLRRVVHAMSGFSGRWVLLPGNHDAALAESVWTRIHSLACRLRNKRDIPILPVNGHGLDIRCGGAALYFVPPRRALGSASRNASSLSSSV